MRERQRETERDRERQRERQRETEKDRDSSLKKYTFHSVLVCFLERTETMITVVNIGVIIS